jgi:hypothetical protein
MRCFLHLLFLKFIRSTWFRLPRFLLYANQRVTQLVRTLKLPHHDYWLACGGSGCGGLSVIDWAQLLTRDTLVAVPNLVCSTSNVTLSITCGLASGGGMVNPLVAWIAIFVVWKSRSGNFNTDKGWLKSSVTKNWSPFRRNFSTLCHFDENLLAAPLLLCQHSLFLHFLNWMLKEINGWFHLLSVFLFQLPMLQVPQKSSYHNWTSFSIAFVQFNFTFKLKCWHKL